MNFEPTFAVEHREVIPEPFRGAHRRHVVTLSFLSKLLPAALISERFAKSLSAETGASVVLIRLQCCDDPPSFDGAFNANATVVDWAPSDLVLQDQLQQCSLIRTGDGFHLLTLKVRPGPALHERISSLLSQLRRHFRYILVEAPPEDTLAPSSRDFLMQSDMAYLFLQATTEDMARLDLVMRELRACPAVNDRLFKPVLVLAEGTRSDTFDSLLQHAAAPIERFIHGLAWRAGSEPDHAPQLDRSGPFNADIRRLARELGGRLVGLALSSGAAKGFAHIGVIQVLEENGIEVDIVAGASIGAYIGALWTYGHDGKELERLALELKGRWGFWRLMDPVFPPRQGFLRGFALRKRLMRSIGTASFADLARPLRVVAGNLGSLDRMTFTRGQVAAAVHASMAVPGICVPVPIDGESYIDGGIVDPVPVNILREAGVDRIIAVNVIPTPERMRLAFQAERELARKKETHLGKLFRKLLPLDKQLNYFAQGNLFEILARSIHGAQVRLADASCRLADVVLRPDIRDDRWLDCRDPGRFIALGREAAEQQLDQIKALAGKNELNNNEREFAPGPMAAVA